MNKYNLKNMVYELNSGDVRTVYIDFNPDVSLKSQEAKECTIHHKTDNKFFILYNANVFMLQVGGNEFFRLSANKITDIERQEGSGKLYKYYYKITFEDVKGTKITVKLHTNKL